MGSYERICVEFEQKIKVACIKMNTL